MRYLLYTILFCISLQSSTLHLSTSSNPSRINPILSTDSASSEISGWLFNSLITYAKDGSIKTEIASSWHFIDDTTLEFKLRDDVKWSDGERCDVDDVIFTYEAITSKDVFTPYAKDFKYVKSLEKIDDLTLRVHYSEPYFKALEIWMMGLLPSHLLKDKNLMTDNFNQKPIGTGPYTLPSFSISNDIELLANPNYFIHKPNIDKIIYHFVPDPSTSFLMLKSGKLDVGSLSPLEAQREMTPEFKQKYQIIEQPANAYTYLGFNLKKEKFQNKKVREAIALAIDKKELIDILFFGHGSICNGPFMPSTGAFNEDVTTPKQDIQKAKELLKEAGYDNKNPFIFETVTNSGNSTRMYALEIIQSQLKKAGIKMKIRSMEWQAFLNTVVHPRNYETILLGWSLSLKPDAYSIWHSDSDTKGGFNLVGYKNERVDTLIKQAEQTVDSKKFDAIYKEIFKLIVEDYPYVFLYIPNTITAVNKEIKNVEPSIIGIMHNQIDWIKP